MSRHYNRVILIGNLTRDPELRYTTNNTAVCDFGLAVNRDYQDGDGEWKEETTFVDITVWGRQAENASQYLNKGNRVFLEGRLRLDKWETDSGEQRSKHGVTAERLSFIDSDDGAGEESPDDVLDDVDVDETEGDVPF